MRQRSNIGFAALAIMGFIAIVGFGQANSRTKHVDAVDAYYQGIFRDLKLTRQGQFGISRMPVSAGPHNSDHPAKDGLEKAKRPFAKEWSDDVWVMGSKGKVISSKSLMWRWPYGVADTRPPKPIKVDRILEFGKTVTGKIIKGEKGPYILKSGTYEVEFRAVRLSQKECLSCHDGAKLNDPVALLAISTEPRIQKN